STDDPSDPDWATESLTLPFAADVNTLTAAEGKLYMLSTAGDLYEGAGFGSWQATGQSWKGITGIYEDQIIGAKQSGDAWKIAAYPSLKEWDAPEGFPVAGASKMLTYTMPIGDAPQTVLVGGRASDGTLSTATWSFDGENWAKVSRPGYGLPVGLEDVAVVEYDLIRVPSSTWSPVQYPAILLFGGRNSEGAINRTVYMTTDLGLTWREAPELLALPEDLPSSYGASAFVYTTVMHASRAVSKWTSLRTRPLPPHCTPELPTGQSRVSTLIDEWDCPAIYMIGGYDKDGKPLNQMWRGVILRYTFRPIC
ncbi:MAG: hypothetical protein NC548_46770, partial [Lachnospiraceae bacterium]|nr:hypothetical protein [Lachnospiraceae bacterium]